jgi:hypothetical protein
VLLAHIRSFLARHRAVHWALVATVALAAGATVASRSAALERERRAWGASAVVWVATDDVIAGQAVIARRIEAPLTLVPATSVRADPTGTAARRDIAAGEVLITSAVGGDDDQVPPGWRGVAIPADETTLAVRVGDRVDVVAAGAVLATDGVVIEVLTANVVVAVDADAAPAVASAALDRFAVLVLRG